MPPTLSNRFQYKEGSKKYKGITHSEALFGVPEYGGELNGRIYYATPGNDTGCTGYSPHPAWAGQQKYILLVDRGECNFVQKVRYAEQQGAMGVVIVDNLCMAGEPTGSCPDYCRPDKKNMCPKNGCDNIANHPEYAYEAPADWEVALGGLPGGTVPMTPFTDIDCSKTGMTDYRLPVMADDGSGHNIAIPSYLISHYDGQLLKNAICGSAGAPWNPSSQDPTVASDSCKSGADGAPVMLTMRWDVPRPTGKVTWSLWTSSEDWHGGTFKQEFKDIAERLYGKAEFSPNYFFYDGKQYNCQSGELRCGNQCLSNGKTGADWQGGYYCRPDPDGSLDQGISGAEIAEENLRQLCLWEMKNGTASGQKMWWDYVNNFALKCFGLVEESAGLKTCHTGQLTVAGVSVADQQKLEECVATNSASPNSELLDRQIDSKRSLNILVLPTIMVNGRLMAGGTQPLTVLKEICSGFLEGTAPDACAAALNPLGAGQASPDGYVWKVQGQVLLSWPKDAQTGAANPKNSNPSAFDYTLRQNFKQRLALELGVVYSSIVVTSVNPATSPTAGLKVGLTVNNLISEESANTVQQKLIQAENDGYFTLVYQDMNGGEDVAVSVYAAGGGQPDIIKTSAATGQNVTNETNVTEGVPVGVVIFIVLLSTSPEHGFTLFVCVCVVCCVFARGAGLS